MSSNRIKHSAVRVFFMSLLSIIALSVTLSGVERESAEDYKISLGDKTKEELLIIAVQNYESSVSFEDLCNRVHEEFEESNKRNLELIEQSAKKEGRMRAYRFQLKAAQVELKKIGLRGSSPRGANYAWRCAGW